MNVTSQLEAVTVYASGAVCTRRVKVAEPTRQVRITGLPLSLRPTSLRARISVGPDGLRVLDVRAGFDAQLAEEVDVPAEQKALEAAEAQLGRIEQVRGRLVQEAQDIGGLRPSFPVLRKSEPPRPAPVDAMLALAQFVDGELAARSVRIRALDQEIIDARNEVQLRQRRLAEASSSTRTERARLSRTAVVTLSADPAQALELALEYQVPGARWVPNYELRLDKAMGTGALKMRASVAQNSGEDWSQVALGLSTAQLDRRTDLPELRALKIGRSQPPAPRSGWREPPPGLDELFSGYDEARSAAPPSGVPQGAAPAPPKGAAQKEASRPQKPSAVKAVGVAPPPSSAAPMAPRQARPSAPMMVPASKLGGGGVLAAFGGAVDALSRSRSVSAEAAPEESEASMDEGYFADGEAPSGASLMYPESAPELAATTIVPEDALLDYDRLTMPKADGPARGQLQPTTEWELAVVSSVSVRLDVVTLVIARAQQLAAQVDALALPPYAAPVRTSAAAFDYRYECAAPIDVASSGKWSLIPVMTAQVGLTPGYSCVPAVEPKVYRVLKVANRSPHALLQGPVDVSVGDEFLMTTKLPTIAPRGDDARLGLGVEEAVKVARKTQFKETTGGLLGGSTVLPHEIEIEVNNRLPHAAAIEIRERVPVSTDTDVKIEETAVSPPWEKDEKVREGVQTDGGRRWQLVVAAGEKTTVTAQFSIKIPAGKMLVGGNRRV